MPRYDDFDAVWTPRHACGTGCLSLSVRTTLRTKFRSQPKVGPELAKSRPKAGLELAQNQPKVGQKLSLRQPKVVPESAQDQPELKVKR